MKRIVLLLNMLYLITACSSMPKVYPDRNVSPSICYRKCGHLFPEGRWQFLHSIETKMPGGRKGMLMGVTQISSVDKTIQSVIMTIEGMVLFDARYERQLVVNRGIPPFDAENFARGLIQDIQLIFFVPPGPLIKSGVLKNGAAVCRFQNPERRFVDIIQYGEDGWEIRQYDHRYKKRHTVKVFFNKKEINPGRFNAPRRLKLTSHDYPGYVLDMDLIEAVPLEDNK